MMLALLLSRPHQEVTPKNRGKWIDLGSMQMMLIETFLMTSGTTAASHHRHLETEYKAILLIDSSY
jgi:hypothetical protein